MGIWELRDWRRFWALEPWGAERDNLHAAMITSMIFNANRSKGTKVRTVDDFMFRESSETKNTQTRKFVAALRAIAKPAKRKR